MPKLSRGHLEKEVRRLLANIPADKREAEDSYDHLCYVYQQAYDQAWNDLHKLMNTEFKNRIHDYGTAIEIIR